MSECWRGGGTGINLLDIYVSTYMYIIVHGNASVPCVSYQ